MTPESPSTKNPKWSANPKADLIQMLERDCVDRCPSVTSGSPGSSSWKLAEAPDCLLRLDFFGRKNKQNVFNRSWTIFVFCYILVYVVHESMPFFSRINHIALFFFSPARRDFFPRFFFCCDRNPGGTPLLGWNKPNLCLKRLAVFF